MTETKPSTYAPWTSMPEEFYDWLDQCPVDWSRIAVGNDSIDYSFIIPD